jgi:hypothetical protein
MLEHPKTPRLRVRLSVRVRRQGGSLVITIPRYITRKWNLEPGSRLVVRSTERGILLYPRYFAPFLYPPMRAHPDEIEIRSTVRSR